MRILLSFIVVTFLFVNGSYGDDLNVELEALKQQMSTMQENMERMQKKIVELEERNKELRSVLDDKPQESDLPQKEEEEDSSISKKVFINDTFRALNPDISVIGVFSAAYYSNDDPVTFAERDPENTGINLQEIELAFQSIVDPYFKFDSYFAISDEGIEIEEGYGTSLFDLPFNSQVRLGRMRAKFGRINTQHRHFHNFATLPIVASRFLGEHLNPVAIESNFLLPLPWFTELSMLVGSPEVETPSFDRDSDSNNLSKLLYNFHLAKFLELSESFSVLLGGSYSTASNGVEDGRTHLMGADMYVKYRPLRNNPYQELRWQSEFMYRVADTEQGEEINDYGFYSELIYKFTKRWGVGVRYGWIDTDDIIELAEQEGEEHEEHEEEGEEENGHGHGEELLGLLGQEYRISTALTFAPTEFSIIRLQYDYLDQDFADNQHGLFLQFQYAIGAHGAHKF